MRPLDDAARLAWHGVTRNRRRLQREQRRLLASAGGSRVLEVGSGQLRRGVPFQSASVVAPPGIDLVMTDVDPALGHRVLDLCDPDPDIGTFDLVLCCNVLEHVHDLAAAVDGLATVCSDTGRVFVATPFLYPYHDEPTDYWRPTAYGIEQSLRRRFDDVQVSWTGLRRLPFSIFAHARGPRAATERPR